MLRPGEDDKISAVEVRRGSRPARDRDLLQSLELIEVRSKWVTNHCYKSRRAIGLRGYRGAILVREFVRKPRHQADYGDAGHCGEPVRPGCQQRSVATKFVENEAAKALPRLARKQCPRPIPMGESTTQDDDLATRHPLRLYENRIHSDVRYRARRQRLQVLRDPDLAALYDASVVRHVLCLERRHPDALPGEIAAESRCDETFSCPARRS